MHPVLEAHAAAGRGRKRRRGDGHRRHARQRAAVPGDHQPLASGRRHGAGEVLGLHRDVAVGLDESVERLGPRRGRVQDRHRDADRRASGPLTVSDAALGPDGHARPVRAHLDPMVAADGAARGVDRQPRLVGGDREVERLLPAVEDLDVPRPAVEHAQGRQSPARRDRPASSPRTLRRRPPSRRAAAPGPPARRGIALRTRLVASTCSRCASGPSCASTCRRRASRCTRAQSSASRANSARARSARSFVDARPCTRVQPVLRRRSRTGR